MIKYIFFTFIVISFFGCAPIQPQVAQTTQASNKKSFEQEDAFILFALRAEQLGDYKSAASLFETLYEKSNKKEYLYRALQNDLSANEFDLLISKVNQENELTHEDDFFLLRLKVLSLIGLQKYNEAKTEALALVQSTADANDYLLVSDIYIQLQEYDTAVRYLESAYAKEYNEKLLDKMSIILYLNLQRQKDAIAQLETHSRIHGCSSLICLRLIAFYSNENNIEGLLSTSLRLYTLEPSDDLAKKIVQIYAYKKDYIGMMSFLEKSQSDDNALLSLYVSTKKYQKAYQLAQKLYKKTADLHYLAQSAIYEYEANPDKSDTKILMQVIKKLQDVVVDLPNPLYLNYLGYILIDHEIDVNKGIEYVNMALESEPNSIYYLDSLAWGYYKLGNCAEAKRVMYELLELDDSDNEELISHIELINKCTNN